jgi:hypothetical protein
VQQVSGWQRPSDAEGDLFAVACEELIARMRAACDEGGEWPERVGAGLYAALGFLADDRPMARALLDSRSSSRFGEPFRYLVQTISQLLDEGAPGEARPGPGTSTAVVAGAGLVVGDCVRLGRFDRLSGLCPSLHLMILLPFLGFEEAKFRAQAFDDSEKR